MRLGYCFVCLLLFSLNVAAAQNMRSDTLHVSVEFERGYSVIDLSFGDNRSEMERLSESLLRLGTDSEAVITGIRIRGSASPDGLAKSNAVLARKRAANIARYLSENTSLPDSLFAIDAVGVDWERLEELVERSDMPYRDEVLHVLRTTPEWICRDGKVVDGRKRRLGMLHGGRAYEYMYRNIFPALRSGNLYTVVCNFETVPDDLPTPPRINDLVDAGGDSECDLALAVSSDPQAEAPSCETVAMPTEPSSPSTAVDTHEALPAQGGAVLATGEPILSTALAQSARNPRFALRTNLLYDATLIPNIGLEYSFAPRWTISADWMHAWWSRNSKHRYWRCYGAEIGLRRYFGDKPFSGHHVGVYGQGLTYDFEFSGKGRQSDGMSFGGGIEYGYSLPLGRCLNLDFSIGVGYFGGRYKEYEPMAACYVWQAPRRLNWFGPTKAGISLVWIIGGNNRTKGGAR